MLTLGLGLLLVILVWEFWKLLHARQHPTISFLLVYAVGVVLLIVGSIAARNAGHAGLSLSSFAASGACLFSLLGQETPPSDDGLAS
jgi:hypothetical protein